MTQALAIMFLDLTPNPRQQKQMNGTTLDHKLSPQKGNNEMTGQPMEWKKMFSDHVSDKQLTSKIDKELHTTQA